MNTVSDNPSSDLPYFLYRAAQVRELDRIAIEEQGMSGAMLMTRAGQAAFTLLQQCWPRARSVGVFCGTGNNGGDGFSVAQLAHEAGYAVRVWQVGDASRIQGDALMLRRQMQATGLIVENFAEGDISEQDVWVDGLLGTGFSGKVTGRWQQAIEVMNQAHVNGSRVLSLDIPSGLQADTGSISDIAVQADACITFIGLKTGLFTGQGPAVCGTLHFDDLAVPAAVYTQLKPAALRLSWHRSTLPPRNPAAHKGDFGHVLVVGGDHGMSGALRLTGEAALRTGAGLVSVATRAAHAAMISMTRPELMSYGVEGAAALTLLLKRASVLAVGPGLGQGEWSRSLFSSLLESTLPMVVDADALNLLAAEPVYRDSWILTPHPGEAARLLGQTVEQVQADRLAAITALQQKYGGVVVLKGAGTVVIDATGEITICSEGNPGMASGGMGDVLTGIIASLLAQGSSLEEAARQGVSLHACAADVAAQNGQRGLLASDLFPVIRQLLS